MAVNALWRQNNPEIKRAGSRNYLARKKQAEGNFTATEWLEKLAACKGRCHWCGEKIGGSVHADHVIPLIAGGSNYISNIVPSCASCNLSKNRLMPWEFAGRLF